MCAFFSSGGGEPNPQSVLDQKMLESLVQYIQSSSWYACMLQRRSEALETHFSLLLQRGVPGSVYLSSVSGGGWILPTPHHCLSNTVSYFPPYAWIAAIHLHGGGECVLRGRTEVGAKLPLGLQLSQQHCLLQPIFLHAD